MNPIVLVCVMVLGLLVFGLGVGVSAARFRSGVLSGSAPDPTNTLSKFVRAHGNTNEYAAFFAVLFLYYGAHNPSASTLAWIVAATVSRCLLALGLLTGATMAKWNPLRFIGATGTYACGIALSVGLLH